MENKTVNIAAEISGQTMQGEALNRFKNLTGNDTVQIERKYKSPFQLNFTGGMLFATNDAPDVTHVDDGDVAFWRRWETVHFPNSFPEGSEKRDPEIEERLKEDSNLSAILNWIILGYGRFRHENDCTFTNARDHIGTQTIWQSWGDALDRFLNTVVEQDEDAADISTREAFEVFKHWCREEGESVDITQAQFTPQAKKKSLGYSKGIDTRRDSQVNAFTAFGTPDELDDPIDIIAAGGGSNDSDAGANTGIDDFDDADAASSDGDPERSDTREEDVENSEDAEANDSPAETDRSDSPAERGTSEGLRDKIKDAIRYDDSGDPVRLTQLQAVISNHRDDITDAVSYLQSTNQVRDTGEGYVLMNTD
jgi:Predicted ATPase